jgi:hypothetical protein
MASPVQVPKNFGEHWGLELCWEILFRVNLRSTLVPPFAKAMLSTGTISKLQCYLSSA